MNRLKSAVLPCVVLAVLAALLLRTAVAEAAPASKCGTWSVVKSPNRGPDGNGLRGVVTVSASNVWTFGSSSAGTLIEHWNGTQWSVVASPNSVSGSGALFGGAAISASNIWVVGYFLDSSNFHQPLIEHWNGSKWSVVPSPNDPFTGDGTLKSVKAISASNIWAVGYAGDATGADGDGVALIEHWNGTQWSVVASPDSGGYDTLSGITAVSASNIWAAGYTQDRNSDNVATLVDHWDGSQWSVVASPNPDSYDALSRVTAVSASDIWAVGFTSTQALIEHWNGTQWSVVSSPPSANGDLVGLAVLSANNIWAVGFSSNSSNVYQTLIERWNGTQWSVVSSPNAGTGNNFLWGVARVRGTSQLWAVGYYTNSSGVGRTLTEFYC